MLWYIITYKGRLNIVGITWLVQADKFRCVRGWGCSAAELYCFYHPLDFLIISSRAESAWPFRWTWVHPRFCGVCVAQSLVFSVVILITPLVSTYSYWIGFVFNKYGNTIGTQYHSSVIRVHMYLVYRRCHLYGKNAFMLGVLILIKYGDSN